MHISLELHACLRFCSWEFLLHLCLSFFGPACMHACMVHYAHFAPLFLRFFGFFARVKPQNKNYECRTRKAAQNLIKRRHNTQGSSPSSNNPPKLLWTWPSIGDDEENPIFLHIHHHVRRWRSSSLPPQQLNNYLILLSPFLFCEKLNLWPIFPAQNGCSYPDTVLHQGIESINWTQSPNDQGRSLNPKWESSKFDQNWSKVSQYSILTQY